MEEDIVYLEEVIDLAKTPNVHLVIKEREIKAIENLIKYYVEQNEVNARFIPKSKIKEKIEELEEEIDKLADEASKSILENNQGKFDLVNKSANNISMQIQALRELMEDK